MAKPIKLIEGVDDLKNRFPNAYEYLMGKRPTGLYIDGNCVAVENTFHGVSLRYDIHDIAEFNKIKQPDNGPASSAD